MNENQNSKCGGCGRSREYKSLNDALICLECNTIKSCHGCHCNIPSLTQQYCLKCKNKAIDIPKLSYDPIKCILVDRACFCGGNYPFQYEPDDYLHCANCRQMYHLI